MNRAEFEVELREQGYTDIVDRRMQENEINSEHSHEFDARLFVLEGEMTITRGGAQRTYRAGETFAMTAGCRHSERSGAEGVRYLAGRRYPAAV
jgi:quercetin dioxygenase-like cupin family protein